MYLFCLFYLFISYIYILIYTVVYIYINPNLSTSTYPLVTIGLLSTSVPSVLMTLYNIIIVYNTIIPITKMGTQLSEYGLELTVRQCLSKACFRETLFKEESLDVMQAVHSYTSLQTTRLWYIYTVVFFSPHLLLDPRLLSLSCVLVFWHQPVEKIIVSLTKASAVRRQVHC